MKKSFFFLLAITVSTLRVLAQVADFNVPSACINQVISPQNTSSGATRYIWDYCQDGLTHLKASSDVITITSANIPVGCKAFYDHNNWFGFVCSRDGGDKLTQLNFGNSLNNTPSRVILNTQLASMTGSSDIDFIQQGGNWFGFVSDFYSSALLRLDYGNSLMNTPVANNLGNLGGWNGIYGIKMIQQGSEYFGLLTSYNTNTIGVLNFGTSILNTPTNTNISGSLINNPVKIEIVKENLQWHALVTSLSNNKLLLLDFGNDLSNIPSITSVADISGASALSVQRDGGNSYAFVFGTNGNLKRLDFGSSSLNAPVINDLGNPVGSSLIYGLCIVKEWPNWKGVLVGVFSNKVQLLTFQDQCTSVSPIASTDTNPELKYTSSGSNIIELAAFSSSGVIDTISRQIVVQNKNAPDLTIVAPNQCVNAPVFFTENLISGPAITSSTWNFGDGNTDNQSSTSNTYASTGSYPIILNVTSANGCANQITKTINIYNPPTSTFALPTNNPLCTNQQFTFPNTSTFDVGSSPGWEWFVNGTFVSTIKDLQQSFSSATAQTIKLKASIPGCFTESSQVINSLLSGPQLGFNVAGMCEGDAVTFTNTTTDPVSGFTWDFGDSQTSTSTDASHAYTNHGNYSVSLQAVNGNGCQNTVTKNIVIYTKPKADFSLSLPPFSCSGSISQFNDLTANPTDSNIASWSWDFGDVSSAQNSSMQKNAQHTYNVAGDYNVSLTAKTNFGCSGTKQKLITIAQSPQAGFSNTPGCRDVPVVFTDTSVGNISSWYWQMDNTFYFVAQPTPTHIFTSSKTYPVSLTVTASNNCISIINKNLVIPVPLVPSFTVEKNCTDQHTNFIDLTNAVADPIQTYNWQFANKGTGTGSPTQFTFATVGKYDVTMNVTALSGCTYSVISKIDIIQGPLASFSASPETGVPPLDVKFTNTSANAKYYAWAFNDNSSAPTSKENSPRHTFVDFGEYVVDLTASNDLSCTSTISKIIKTVLPTNDIAIIALNAIKNADGSLKIIATLKNNGNMVLQNLPLVADVSGFTSIRESVAGPIAPAATYNYTFTYEILLTKGLDFLCGDIQLDNDINTTNNKFCTSLNDAFYLYAPYPNPANTNINLDWINPEAEPLEVEVFDAMSKLVVSYTYQGKVGLNQVDLSITALENGIYVFHISNATTSKIYKVAIAH